VEEYGMQRIILVALALASGPAIAQIGGSTGTATSPGIGGAQSGMSGGNNMGGGGQQQGGGTATPRPPGIGNTNLGPGQPLPQSPADRSPIGGSAVGGSGVPGTATGDLTPR